MAKKKKAPISNVARQRMYRKAIAQGKSTEEATRKSLGIVSAPKRKPAKPDEAVRTEIHKTILEERKRKKTRKLRRYAKSFLSKT